MKGLALKGTNIIFIVVDVRINLAPIHLEDAPRQAVESAGEPRFQTAQVTQLLLRRLNMSSDTTREFE
jgi:hypothetical protein